jgi:hypothetical protein
MAAERGWELRVRWPARTPTDAELEALVGRELVRAAVLLGRRRVRNRLAADALLREALRELDGAAAENESRRG